MDFFAIDLKWFVAFEVFFEEISQTKGLEAVFLVLFLQAHLVRALRFPTSEMQRTFEVGPKLYSLLCRAQGINVARHKTKQKHN